MPTPNETAPTRPRNQGTKRTRAGRVHAEVLDLEALENDTQPNTTQQHLSFFEATPSAAAEPRSTANTSTNTPRP